MGESSEIVPVAPSEADSGQPPEHEDQRVEIHKPKPAHSWREFAIEIGTIVCGILIALGLEQAIEAAHSYSEVHEARDALREEIKDDVETLVFGMAEDKCLVSQLDAYAAWARGGARPAPFRTALSGYSFSNWDTIKTNAVTHMPLHERLAVADFYDRLSNEQKVVELQRSHALTLIGTEDLQELSQADKSRILEATAIERKLAVIHAANGQDILESAGKLGVRPVGLSPDARNALSQMCGKSAS
jgi:hypothetical protein